MSNAKDLAGALPGYFKIEDLEGKPPVTYTITFAGQKPVGKEQEDKPILEFAETRKALVLNATRCKQLAGIFGEAELRGSKVTLAVRDENVNGKKFEMICIDAAE